MLGVLDDSSNKILSDSRDELMIGVELSWLKHHPAVHDEGLVFWNVNLQ
jgi:hypothetical protein